MVEEIYYCNPEYKPWLSIKELELKGGIYNIVIDIRNIGLFEMGGFKEYYTKEFIYASRVREADYVELDIHESQVGEIELLYRTKDIDSINVIFEDGHVELFRVPENQNYRITSTGDLRIEMGLATELQEVGTEDSLDDEHCSAVFYGRNFFDTFGCIKMINEEKHRQIGLDYEKIDHVEIIKGKTNELLDILGEIVSCNGKKLSKKKLIALATLVDYTMEDDLHISDYTILFEEDIRNPRIDSLKSKEYIGREVKDTNLKQIIRNVYEKYKNKTFVELQEYIDDYMCLEAITSEKDEFDIEKELDELDKIFSDMKK